MFRFKLIGSLLGLLMLPLLVACNDGSKTPKTPEPSAADAEMLTVYKSPTCGCCSGLIALDTLIRDNSSQRLRCHYEQKTSV
jgi:hypothetical protein